MKKLIFTVLLSMGALIGANAQSLKLGHVNSQNVINDMPEYKEMTEVLKAKNDELMKELQELEKVYMTKMKEYEDPSTSETRKKVLQGDIIDLESRVQQRQESGQAQLEQLSVSLRTPLLEKIDKAIKETASENKMNYVFDTAALLYFEGGEDLTNKVRAKLGLPVAP